jgi:hypothetical protein
MRNTLPLHLAALLLAGCAAHPDPIVDMQGVDSAMYEQDLDDCQGYGDQIDPATGVTKGVAAGGTVGAATGAISGHTAKGAGYGAIAGGARSAQLNEREKQQVVKNCMRGRGYRVLN